VLDANVPLITLSGRTPVSRMAGGLLHAAGLDPLITTTLEGYEELAVQLAGDPSRRLAIQEDMRRLAPGWRLAPARLARSLEEQLIAMVV
jgi:predicted O-linked N-acetylglucosamine transferase (SPINDLY family)